MVTVTNPLDRHGREHTAHEFTAGDVCQRILSRFRIDDIRGRGSIRAVGQLARQPDEQKYMKNTRRRIKA